MTDSDEDVDANDCVNLTGFLFGNIDESGRLEGDVFDPDTQKQLSSLGRQVDYLHNDNNKHTFFSMDVTIVTFGAIVFIFPSVSPREQEINE